nr:hypothetical protein [uncultured Draconibacterium sp.]
MNRYTRSSFLIKNKGIIIALALLFFPIGILTEIHSYDEIFVAICLLYFVFFKKKWAFDKSEKMILICLIVSFILGIVSNAKSKIIPFNFSVFIDLFSIYKYVLVFLFLRNISKIENRQITLKLIITLSKAFIIIAFPFGILSQFVDIGMTYQERYGIKAFHFIFSNHSHFGILIIASLIVISFFESNKKFIIYFLLSSISLILTTKGVVYSFLVFSAIFFFFSRNSTIKIRALIIPIAILVAISSLQINTYLKNENSVRMIFLSYSIITANEYLPFGSGFATYGSAEAAKNYSPLYYKYGFNNRYGLSDNPGDDMYLNDNYWATIIGELGYLGFILMLLIFLYIFKIFNAYTHIDKRTKAFLISALLMLLISSIATGIIKSNAGTFMFAVFAILLPNNKYENANQTASC